MNDRLRRSRKAPKPTDFWRTKTLAELATEQNVKPIKKLEDILGGGADLWRDDEELDAFLRQIRERRKTK